MTSKDYSKLFSELSEAATAYEIANDQDGAKVNQHRVSGQHKPVTYTLAACLHAWQVRERSDPTLVKILSRINCV